MDLNELERTAMRGEPMPGGLSLVNQVYFQGLKYLYAQFRAGFIDREHGSQDKGKMLYERDLWERKEDSNSKLALWHANLRRNIESAQIHYRKERTLENADRLSAALDGRLL